jgi:hypothetical protein
VKAPFLVAVGLFVALALCQCGASQGASCTAGWQACVAMLGDLCGPEVCSDDVTDDPSYGAQALNDPEGTCTCLMAQTTQGITWPKGATCAAPDTAYASAAACFSDHCAKECP